MRTMAFLANGLNLFYRTQKQGELLQGGHKTTEEGVGCYCHDRSPSACCVCRSTNYTSWIRLVLRQSPSNYWSTSRRYKYIRYLHLQPLTICLHSPLPPPCLHQNCRQFLIYVLLRCLQYFSHIRHIS